MTLIISKNFTYTSPLLSRASFPEVKSRVNYDQMICHVILTILHTFAANMESPRRSNREAYYISDPST